jgi:hypothetical protein
VPVKIELRDPAEGGTGLSFTSRAGELPAPPDFVLSETLLRRTIESYDSNAKTYAERFQFVDLGRDRRRFLQQLPDTTRILCNQRFNLIVDF